MPQLQITHPYTPALRRSIELALGKGLVSDAEQAAVEHRSSKSIAERWQRIAEALGIPEGERRRERVIVELFRQHHAKYMVVALSAVLSLSQPSEACRCPRTPRANPAVVAIRRMGEISQPLTFDLEHRTFSWS